MKIEPNSQFFLGGGYWWYLWKALIDNYCNIMSTVIFLSRIYIHIYSVYCFYFGKNTDKYHQKWKNKTRKPSIFTSFYMFFSPLYEKTLYTIQKSLRLKVGMSTDSFLSCLFDLTWTAEVKRDKTLYHNTLSPCSIMTDISVECPYI